MKELISSRLQCPMIIQDAQYVLSAPGVRHLPQNGLPEFAFIGRSNVGKSSLLNYVLGRKALCRVSRTPGRTRALNVFLVSALTRQVCGNGQCIQFQVLDLPGYGFARLPQGQKRELSDALSQYLTQRNPISMVFHLLDGRREPNCEDLEIHELLLQRQIAHMLVITKLDKLSISKQRGACQSIAEAFGLSRRHVIMTSASAPFGRDELLKKIQDHVYAEPADSAA